MTQIMRINVFIHLHGCINSIACVTQKIHKKGSLDKKSPNLLLHKIVYLLYQNITSKVLSAVVEPSSDFMVRCTL